MRRLQLKDISWWDLERCLLWSAMESWWRTLRKGYRSALAVFCIFPSSFRRDCRLRRGVTPSSDDLSLTNVLGWEAEELRLYCNKQCVQSMSESRRFRHRRERSTGWSARTTSTPGKYFMFYWTKPLYDVRIKCTKVRYKARWYYCSLHCRLCSFLNEDWMVDGWGARHIVNYCSENGRILQNPTLTKFLLCVPDFAGIAPSR